VFLTQGQCAEYTAQVTAPHMRQHTGMIRNAGCCARLVVLVTLQLQLDVCMCANMPLFLLCDTCRATAQSGTCTEPS
jgi:hypothetical protein